MPTARIATPPTDQPQPLSLCDMLWEIEHAASHARDMEPGEARVALIWFAKEWAELALLAARKEANL